jgi:hypothetical protein
VDTISDFIQVSSTNGCALTTSSCIIVQSTSTTCKTTYFTSFDAVMSGNNV